MMDLDTYLRAMLFFSVCCWFWGVSSRVVKYFDDKPEALNYVVLYHIMRGVAFFYVVVLVFILSIPGIKLVPILIVAIVVYKVGPDVVDFSKIPKWPMLGLLLIPAVFHLAPVIGYPLS